MIEAQSRLLRRVLPKNTSATDVRRSSPDNPSKLTQATSMGDPLLDPDAGTIESTKRTFNKTVLILARGHARRSALEPRMRPRRLPVVLTLIALFAWIDPATIAAFLRG